MNTLFRSLFRSLPLSVLFSVPSSIPLSVPVCGPSFDPCLRSLFRSLMQPPSLLFPCVGPFFGPLFGPSLFQSLVRTLLFSVSLFRPFFPSLLSASIMVTFSFPLLIPSTFSVFLPIPYSVSLSVSFRCPSFYPSLDNISDGSAGTGTGGVHWQRGRGNDLDAGERVREEHRRGARHVLPALRRVPGAVLGELRQVWQRAQEMESVVPVDA